MLKLAQVLVIEVVMAIFGIFSDEKTNPNEPKTNPILAQNWLCFPQTNPISNPIMLK